MTTHKPGETAGENRVAALVEGFGRDYPSYQYAFVNFLVDHLSDLSRCYGGDFQQILILAIIGQRRMNIRRRVDLADLPGPEAMAISASRLADVTGIPRESVRRKLEALRQKGWVTQGPNGGWSLSEDPDGRDLPVRRDHFEFDQRSRRRIARLVATLESFGRTPEG